MKYEIIRGQVLDALRRAAACGLIRGASGNVSVRDGGSGVIAISPSARPYDSMTAEEIAIVAPDGTWLDGPYKPSSETPMHTAVYRAREDVGAIVHVHGLFSTVMAMEGKELPPSTPPQAELAPIRIAPFAPPGSGELARLAVETLGADGRAILLRNHGSLCCGREIEAALSAAIYTEEAAQTACYAKLLGSFRSLDAEQIAAVKAALADYGAV